MRQMCGIKDMPRAAEYTTRTIQHLVWKSTLDLEVNYI